jgi:hypothetical protein
MRDAAMTAKGWAPGLLPASAGSEAARPLLAAGGQRRAEGRLHLALLAMFRKVHLPEGSTDRARRSTG